MKQENPYNLDFVLNEATYNQTPSGVIKMDAVVVNEDVLRTMRMIYSITGDWGDEYAETVHNFFSTPNLTVSIASALGYHIVAESS